MFFLYSHNYELAFGISMKSLDKAQRLLYGESLMTHAMVFTGLSWEVRKKKKQAQDLLICRKKVEIIVCTFFSTDQQILGLFL